MKNNLFTRLSNNLFTNELLEISLDSQINDDILCELIHLNDIKEGDISLTGMKNATATNIAKFKTEKSNLKNCNEPEVIEIKKLLIENSPHLPWKLFNIIKF